MSVEGAVRRRSIHNIDLVHLHDLRLKPGDTQHFGPFSVTTPERTMIDLLHDPDQFGRIERVACRLLSAVSDGGLLAIHQRVLRTKRPHRNLASTRLVELRGKGPPPASG